MEFRQELESWIERQSLEQLDFEALEMAARRSALQLAARVIQRCLNADHSDREGPHLPCTCGQMARYAGRRTKTVQSVLGAMDLERAWYHCRHCDSGFAPRDRSLGVEHSSVSPGVLRMIGSVGATVSFEEGSALLAELAGIAVETKQVERLAEKLGADIAHDEKQNIEPAGPQLLPKVLYLGLDGTGVAMRKSEVTGRSGSNPTAPAKTREVKLCTIWSAESRGPELPERDQGSVTYSAAIESAATLDTHAVAAEFTQRVLRGATRRRFTDAERTVIISDGAAWIWNIAQELFPRATGCRSVSRQTAFERAVEGSLWRRLQGAPSHGLNAGIRNSIAAASMICSEPFAVTQITTTKLGSACSICTGIAIACATPNSKRKGSVLRPALLKRVASLPLALGSNARACTGPSPAPTPSSPCAAHVSADGFRITGAPDRPEEGRMTPHLLTFSRAPLASGCTTPE